MNKEQKTLYRINKGRENKREKLGIIIVKRGEQARQRMRVKKLTKGKEGETRRQQEQDRGKRKTSRQFRPLNK